MDGGVFWTHGLSAHQTTLVRIGDLQSTGDEQGLVCILYDTCTKVIDTWEREILSSPSGDVQHISGGGKARLARLARLRCEGWGLRPLGRI